MMLIFITSVTAMENNISDVKRLAVTRLLQKKKVVETDVLTSYSV